MPMSSLKVFIGLSMLRIVLCDNPHRITNEGGFSSFVRDVNSGTDYSGTTVYLDTDLSFSSYSLNPIGTCDYHFRGVFDGQGHVISNLKTSSSFRYDGLFGYSEGASIKNVVIDDSCSITNSGNNGDQEYGPYVGGIIGSCSSETSKLCIVESCVNMGNVTYNGSSANLYVGGIAGAIAALKNGNKTMIVNCVNYGTLSVLGTINGWVDIGGIVGEIYIDSPSYIAYLFNCVNFGSIKNICDGESYNIGGISGNSHGSTIENCVNVGTISSDEGTVGGIIGYGNNHPVTVSHCYWTNPSSYVGTSTTKVSASGLLKITSLNSSLINELNNYALNNGWNKWLLNSDSAYVTFKFNDNKGFPVKSQVVLLPDLSATGSNFFRGWFTSTTYSSYSTPDYVSSTTFYGLYGVVVSVTFYGNGGSASQGTKYVRKGYPYGELATAKKIGYDFDGWYTSSSSGTQVTKDSTVKITSTQTLYAHWTPRTFTVNFDKNNGDSVSKAEMTVTYDSKYGELATTSRTGYSFDGWFNATVGGTQFTKDSTVIITSTQTLYAHWTPRTFTVKFEGNGADSVSKTEMTVTYDKPYGELATTSRAGYDFDGWFNATVGGTQFTKDSTVKITTTQTLYAHWTPLTFTVKFEGNGADNVSKAEMIVTYDSKYGDLATASRTGYDFDGWFSETIGGTQYTKDSTVKITATQTLYAHWTPRTFTVNFDKNNGDSVSKAEMTVTYDKPYGDLATASRTGYDFDGWYTSSSGDIQVTNETTVKITSDQTLYAHWTPLTFTVKFEGNGADSVSKAEMTVIYDQSYGELATASRTGYSFDGWFNATVGGTQFTKDNTVKITADQTLYAKWSITTVYFNTNGGNNAPASKGVLFNSTYGDLPTPNKTGYTFVGWFTEIPEGDLVTNSTVVTLDYDHTLYAHWKPIQYTISFVSDGESVCPNITQDYDTPITLLEPSKTGYTFVCWCNDTDLQFEYTAKRVESRNVTLYAKWKASNYAVSFKEECKDSRPPVSVTYNSTYNIPEPSSELGFLWWEIVETGQKVNSESIVEITQNHTLCAFWKTNTVTFNATGGNDDLEPVNATYGEKYENLTNGTRTGYTFVGWFFNETSTEQVTNDTNVTIPYPHTLYARWRINSYTVTFDLDNGENVDIKMFEYNSTVVYPKDPEKRGYSFSGWDNVMFNLMPAEDVIVTALWEANNYTVTLDVNGGDEFVDDEIEVTFNSTYGVLPVPTKEGYSFAWWVNDEDEIVEDEMIVNKTDDHTLYAQWNANNYIVTLDVNGGDELDNKKTNVTFNSTYGDLPTPSRTGYTFVGWLTEIPEGDLVTSSTVVTISHGHTLYAHWKSIQYTISFMSNGGNTCDNITQDYDTPITFPEPSKTGYTFIYWCSDIDLKIEYTAKRIESRNVTLYARWTPNIYTVILDVNGGDDELNNKEMNVTFNSPYGTLPVLTNMTGHTFAGWTDSLFGGNEVDSSAIVSVPNNHTLYALWTINQYTVSFMSEGMKPVNITLNYNDMIIYPNENPSKSFHKFRRWCTRSEKGEEECNVTHVPDHNLTFTAYFDVDSSLITGITAVGAFAVVLLIILLIIIVFLIRVTRTVKHEYEVVGVELEEDLNERKEDIEERIRQQVEATSISVDTKKKLEKPLKKADKNKGVEEILMDLEVDCENSDDIGIIDSYRTTNASVAVANAINNEKNLIVAAEYLAILYYSVREQEEYEKFSELYFGMKDVDDFMNNMDEKTICFSGVVSGFTSKKVAIHSLISKEEEEEEENEASMPSGVLFRVQNGMGYRIGKVDEETNEVLFELCSSFKIESMKEISKNKYIVANLSFVSPMTKDEMINL